MKILTNFFGDLSKVKHLKKWEIENNLIGSYMHYGKKMLNRIVVKIFLKEKGYKLEQNVKLKS